MPARDKIHEAVIRALEKQGWRVEREHYKLYPPERVLFVDLHIKNMNDERNVLVDINSYHESGAQIQILANAIGKYLIYRQAMDFLEIEAPLYLAVPEMAYNGVLSESWLTPLFDQLQIKWIVVDVVSEEVVLWT